MDECTRCMMKHLFQSRYPPNAEAKAIISPLKGNSWNDSSVGVDDRESAEAPSDSFFRVEV